MFETIQPIQPDAILGLNEAFQADPNPKKVNLTVGAFTDDEGVVPVLECVTSAARHVVDTETTKAYLNIAGDPNFRREVGELLAGSNKALLSDRAVTVQAPGGTGGLRVVADFVTQNFSGSSVWLSQPTWPNHPNVFRAAGVPVHTYAYYDAASHRINFSAMLDAVSCIPAGDLLVIHGCCHNPTGADLNQQQWIELADVVRQRRILPIVDFAYQGFAAGLDEDAEGVRQLANAVDELVICSSFSKNLGLYRERVGAITVLAADEAKAERVLAALKKAVRANYSNPPAFGAAIVACILNDTDRRAQWYRELDLMRARLREARQSFAAAMSDKSVDFSFLTRQFGMFSLTGLTPQQVDQLREKYAIYMVRNSRMNLAAINQRNLDYVTDGLCAVLSK